MSRGGETPDDTTNLLNIPTYFRSPVNTLVASLQETPSEPDITSHDVLDAYSTFILRISTVARSLLHCNDARSLQCVRGSSTSLSRCIQRDIRLALADPLAVAKSQTSATSSWLEAGLSDEQIYSARTTSAVCQSAFNLLSNIFSFPALYSLFPDHVLRHLLKDVLTVVQAPELPSLDDVKIRSLAGFALATLQLPAEIVQANRSDIMEYLKDWALTMSPQLQACGIIHNMLSTYPHIFLRASAELLPDILSKLTSTTAAGRMDAAIALAGFALAFLTTSGRTVDFEIASVHMIVHKFIRSQMPSSRRGPNQPTPNPLPDCIAHAAKGSPTESNGNSPRWAIAVICCLIVLSGQGIFTGQRAFRLVLNTVEQVARTKNPVGIDLVACVWKCLAWTFFQLPHHDTSVTGGSGSLPDSQREVIFNLACYTTPPHPLLPQVFAGNLAYSTTDEGLKAFFAPVQADVLSAQVIMRSGNRSAGYGFVSFTTAEAAQKAVELLDKKELDGRPVIVEVAKPADQKDKEKKQRRPKRRTGRRGSKSVPGEVSEAEANGEASTDANKAEGASPANGDAAKPKKKKKARKPKRKSAAATSEGEAPASGAEGATSGAEGTGEKKPRQRKPRTPRPARPAGEDPQGEPSKSVLFVANLGFNIDDEGLAKLFTDAGIKVNSARIVRRRWGKPRKSKGYGFVDVGDEEEQKKAIEALQGKEVGGRAIAVKIAVNTQHEDGDASDSGAPNDAAPTEEKKEEKAPEAAPDAAPVAA
ncbi:hypothetical protein NUW54_g8003 [Trametes sanguinea]|uniref:Uncharacterized protein n=1 Tax=Trametes sanguinea TaxID=158606 RepID=A0ACC1PJ43_9APHY|nr:hypothetical protein NUW54_g8003 [Trametes sanguinea]